jgi:hypothetical protein
MVISSTATNRSDWPKISRRALRRRTAPIGNGLANRRLRRRYPRIKENQETISTQGRVAVTNPTSGEQQFIRQDGFGELIGGQVLLDARIDEKPTHQRYLRATGNHPSSLRESSRP